MGQNDGFKALPDKAPMENVDATYPMELVHMDYLTIKANEGGKDVHILVITDHFTRYVQAIVTSPQMAKCTAQNLWDKFTFHYGLPEKILTDQGRNFDSDLLKALCEIAQVNKIRTSGYHPQTNGQCECFNATLINMLGTLPDKLKSTWREQVPIPVHAYNCTRNKATGFSPYYLMFGQKLCLPIDLLFGKNTVDLKGNSIIYIENLKKQIQWAYQTANEAIKKEQERNKQRYDYKVRCAKLMVGAKVLLRCTAFKGKHKIQDRWENTIYEVVEQPLGKLPVFKIQSMGGDDKEKVVHRNLLLPLFSDPSDRTSEQENKSLVDPQVAIVMSAIASHVHNPSACEGAQVTNMFQRGLDYVTALFQKH